MDDYNCGSNFGETLLHFAQSRGGRQECLSSVIDFSLVPVCDAILEFLLLLSVDDALLFLFLFTFLKTVINNGHAFIGQ